MQAVPLVHNQMPLGSAGDQMHMGAAPGASLWASLGFPISGSGPSWAGQKRRASTGRKLLGWQTRLSMVWEPGKWGGVAGSDLVTSKSSSAHSGAQWPGSRVRLHCACKRVCLRACLKSTRAGTCALEPTLSGCVSVGCSVPGVGCPWGAYVLLTKQETGVPRG